MVKFNNIDEMKNMAIELLNKNKKVSKKPVNFDTIF